MIVRTLICVAIAALLAACTAERGYRLTANYPDPKSWPTCDNDCAEDNSMWHHVSYEGKGASRKENGAYIVSTVEFDDQGWAQRPKQMLNLIQFLEDYQAANKQHFIIVVYAHGWKHDARKADPDLASFQNLLQDAHNAELRRVKQMPLGKQKPRKVVGVYLSWRGASTDVAIAKEATFWARKNAAERVGENGAKELLIRLNEFKAFSNGQEDDSRLAGPDETQLIVIGHSFGGLLVYKALNTQIMERALRRRVTGGDQIAKSFGDFVLLINPAFEGAAYETLFRVSQGYEPTRRKFDQKQRPVMMVATSTSDWATALMFPLGRFYTLDQSAPQDEHNERTAVLKTVGHLPDYATHLLAWDKEREECVGQYYDLDKEIGTLGKLAEKSAADDLRDAEFNLQEVPRKYGCASLYTRDNVVSRQPFYVVRVSPDVIPDHTTINNPRFSHFIRQFIGCEVTGLPATATEQEKEQCRQQLIPASATTVIADPANLIFQ